MERQTHPIMGIFQGGRMKSPMRGRLLGTVLVAAAAAMAGCTVPPVRQGLADPAPSAAPLPATDILPVKFARVETMRVGTGGFNVQFGWLCEHGPRKAWQHLAARDYALLFSRVLQGLGFRVDPPTASLFEDPDLGSDFQVGATIEATEANLCFPFSGRPSLDVGNPDIVKGHAQMAVRWEVYSRSRKQVVYSLRTEGAVSLPESVRGGAQGVYARLFAANVERLAGDPGFRGLVTRASPRT